TGDNVTQPSSEMPWYSGPTLLDFLESVEVESDRAGKAFRMPIQWVNRPHLDFRGYSGTIASGRIKPGDRVTVLPSGRTTTVTRVVTMDGDLPEAVAGRAVTLTVADEIDASRGNVIASDTSRPTLSEQFAAHIVWMSDSQMLPGRSYLLALGGNLVSAQVTELKHKVNVNTLEHT